MYMIDSATAPELYLRVYLYICASYNGVYIDMFVYVIQFKCGLYFILGILYYTSPMNGLFLHVIFDTY